MNYVRTSAGGMMPINFKSNTLIADKKQVAAVKPIRKTKKTLVSEPK